MGNPSPFPSASHVPIVGQPIEATGFTVVVPIVCKCERQVSLILVLTNGQGVPVRCSGCGKLWVLGAGTKVHLELTQMLAGPPPAAGSV